MAMKLGLKVLDFALGTDVLEPYEDIPIILTIKNMDVFNQTKVVNFALATDDDQFFLGNVDPAEKGLKGNEKHSFKFILTTAKQPNLELLPSQKELKLLDMDNNGALLCSHFVQIPIDPYVKGLLKKEALSLLLVGPMATGKSAFVNSAFSMLDQNPLVKSGVSTYATSRSSTSSVTLNLTRYKPGFQAVNSPKIVPSGINISITDTWGFEENNDKYPTWLWDYLVSGKVPDGFQMSKVDLKIPPKEASTWKSDYPINVVLIAMTVNAVDSKNYLNKLKTDILPLLSQKGLNPVVLLTQVDNIDPNLRNDPFDRFSKYPGATKSNYETVTELRNKVSTKLTIPVANIIPMVNYTEEVFRTWGIDRAIYVLLRQAFLVKKQ